MIHFDLRCDDGHAFDGWFRSGEDFERQQAMDLVACPACGSVAVEKALMRPAVAVARQGGGRPPAPAPTATTGGGVPPEKVAEIRAKLQEMARELRAGSHDVGSNFAEEARRIHFGESAERRIHGEATAAEVKALAEDGIAAFPLPPLPEDGH